MNTKQILRALIPCLLFIANALPARGQCYELVWSEEFNYHGLPNPAVWNMETGGNGWGNSEWEYYLANDTDNCIVSNGTLKIIALKENYSTNNYTSARIQSKAKIEFQYGKMEARIKMPYGQGIWPAFWMLGDSKVNWPGCGEIDIVEMIGGSASGRDNTCYGTLHWDNNGHQQSGGNKKLASGILADTFHLYAIEWNKTSVKFLLDGVKYYEVATTSSTMNEFQNYFYFILNLAVGGKWPGYPDASTVFPQTMEVDYIRVYKSADMLTIHGKTLVGAKERQLVYSLDTVSGRQFNWVVPDGVSLLTRSDSNAIVVDWGCGDGDIICNLTNGCGTSQLKLPVKVAPPQLNASIFYDQKAGNQIFSVPCYPATEYHWTVPEGVNIISGVDSCILTAAWNNQPGTIGVTLANSCFVDTFTQYLRHYEQLPYPDPDKPHAIPGTINSVDYDYGGEGVAYHDSDGANQGGGPRPDERVDTQVQALFSCISYIVPSEWLEYTIAVKDSGFYKITLQVASANTTNVGPIRIFVNGESSSRIADIPVPTTGAWTTFKPITAGGLKLTPSDTVLRIMAVKGGFNLGPFTFAADPNASIEKPLSGNNQLAIWPNPASNLIHVETSVFAENAPVELVVTDLSGRILIHKDSFTVAQGLDISSLKQGYYILELKDRTNVPLMVRFLKQ